MGLRQRLLFNIDSRLSIELNTQPRVWEESGEPADNPGLGLGKIIADARDTDKNPQCRAMVVVESTPRCLFVFCTALDRVAWSWAERSLRSSRIGRVRQGAGHSPWALLCGDPAAGRMLRYNMM